MSGDSDFEVKHVGSANIARSFATPFCYFRSRMATQP